MSETLTLDSATAPQGLSPNLRIRLSLMMFIQYAVWGAWWSVLGKYLVAMGLEDAQIGRVFTTMAVASIVSPLIFGQIADRWVPTQYLLGGLHLAGSVCLYLLTRMETFGSFYTCTLIYALLFIPTVSLTNALSLHHVPNATKHFPGIRVFGTIGWIVAGLYVGWRLNESSPEPIALAFVLSIVTGVYCLTLPHTPPKATGEEMFPFIKAVGLLKDGAFAVFVAVSFIISVILSGYFVFTAVFLEDIGVEKAAGVMTVGQFTEMILLPFLPLFIKWLGMKRTLLLGMLAWGLRYGIFAIGEPTWFVIAGIALHGICYDFFFVASYIHVDNKATPDIRASAQALYNLVTMGLGMWIGGELFGRLVGHFRNADDVVAWTMVWTYPAVSVLICMAIFALAFKERKK